MDIAFAHEFGYGFNPFLAFFGFIFNLLFFVFFIGFILWMVRGFKRGRWGHGPWKQMKYAGGPWGLKPERMREGMKGWFDSEGDAQQTARERFARGEITLEQFQTIKAGLEAEQAQATRQAKSFWNRDSALETARMRFAKGEISLEEYEAIKQGLES